MIASGASIKAVQRALRDASAKTTLDSYGSLSEDDLESGGLGVVDQRRWNETVRSAKTKLTQLDNPLRASNRIELSIGLARGWVQRFDGVMRRWSVRWKE